MNKIYVKLLGWWLPPSIFGFFRQTMSALKAAWMAYRIIVFPPSPKPSLILMDVHLVALYMLKLFASYPVVYIENFYDFKLQDACYEHSLMPLTLWQAKWIKYADEIIVESVGFAELFKKSYPALTKEPKIVYPAIDMGVWLEPGINIHRFIPDLMDNTIIFVTTGKYHRSSNIKLALDAFEMLLDLIDDKTVTKHYQLVIAGFCKTSEEKCYYNEMVSLTKERRFASQVTFLKKLPIIHEKTLMTESTIIIHPAKNDIQSESLLRAMSLGKPIVATNRGIASKLLTHRLSGIIIDPDPRLFAVAMKKLVMSPHLQIFLGDMAKDTFQKQYSFDSLCDRMRRILKRHVKQVELKKPVLMALPNTQSTEEE